MLFLFLFFVCFLEFCTCPPTVRLGLLICFDEVLLFCVWSKTKRKQKPPRCTTILKTRFSLLAGPRIQQCRIAAISSGQFRVRVVDTSHHSITVHREPEQQLHITSSLSSTPHNQPQHAVVKFQWMVRVNIFEKEKESKGKKDCRNKEINKTAWNQRLYQVSQWNEDWKKHGRPKRSIKGCLNVSERECMDIKEARTATYLNFSPPKYFFESLFLLRDCSKKKGRRERSQKACYLRVEAWIFVHKDFTKLKKM